MSKKKEKKESRTYIGGQAVLEGVMMRGKTAYATAVRDPEGNIQVESRRLNASKGMKRVAKIPLVRGVVNFVSSLVTGSKILMRSAEVYGDEGKPSKFEKWCEEKLHINLMSAISFIATILGVVLAVGLFIVLPMVLVNLLVRTGGWLVPRSIGYNLLQGLFRLIIFILYIVAITAMKDIRRVFMYHGAEHKTITCFEKGMELTPENAKTCSRIHDRCGTTFLFLVMAISIVVFSVVNWVCDAYLDIFDYGTVVNFLIEFAIKILFLPIVAGISYEVLKLLAKSQSKILLPVKAPGFALQKLTTREPSEDMLEVAIAAFKKVYEMDADPSVPETDFTVSKSVQKYTEELKTLFAEKGIDETDFTVSKSVQKYTEELKTLFAEKGIDESDAEWLVAMKTGVARSGLAESDKMLVPSEVKELDALAGERMAGKPLWYVLGSASFYGYEIKTDARALIPRPETEMLAELAIKTAEDGNSVLDLCTGSGCIAVAVANETKKQGKSVKVTASDISADALALAAENVKANGAEVALVESDLLSGIRGKFDVIVCNPPYIKRGDLSSLQSEVRDYEPMSALDGGEDGLDFYRRLAKDAPKKLKKGGTLLMECGQGQAQEIVKLFKKFDYAMITRDLEGIERYIRAVL